VIKYSLITVVLFKVTVVRVVVNMVHQVTISINQMELQAEIAIDISGTNATVTISNTGTIAGGGGGGGNGQAWNVTYPTGYTTGYTLFPCRWWRWWPRQLRRRSW